MIWIYVLIPLMAAFIGWLTIWMAIKILFHPVKPYRVFGMTIQGIVPARRHQFAEKMGRLVSNELLSFSDLEQKITHPDNIKKILPSVEQHIDQFLRQRLKEVFPMISMFIGDKTINQLKEVFLNELETLFPVIMKNYMGNLKQDLDLERLVADKVLAFSGEKLESNLYQAAAKELRLAKALAALLGLVIGILQVLLIIILMG